MKLTVGVDLDGLVLASPVMVASGFFGSGKELSALVDVRKFGAAVTNTVTLRPSKGLPTPRFAETASGMLAAVGWQNPGIEAFVERDLPELREHGIPLMVSVGGTTVEEFVRVTALLQGVQGIAALEANLSCPDLDRGGAPFAVHLKAAIEVVGAMSRLSMLPVFAKLSAETSELLDIADGCVRAGAHGVTLIGPLAGMAIDPKTLRPRLASTTGWLSGPAIKPVALRAVFEVARAIPGVPLIGVGGIRTAEDAVEFLLAGAWAVQVGSAVLADPAAPIEIAQGVGKYLKDKGLFQPADIRGRVRLREPAAPGGSG